MTNQITQLELHKAIVEPTVVPYMLAGPDAPEILDRFNGIVDSKFSGNPRLKVISLRKINGLQTLVGSSPLILPVMNGVIGPKYGVMRPEEVEKTLREGDPMRIQGNHYIDEGLVLDFSGNNHDLAVQTFNELPQELRDFDRLPGVMIDYGLVNSEIGGYGVAPVYQDGTKLRTAKILLQSTGKFEAKDQELMRLGLPLQLGNGKRTLYTAAQKNPSLENLGLSGLDLGRDLSLDANYEDLADSYDYGRVASVVREAARKN